MALVVKSLAKTELSTTEGDLYGGSTALPAGKAAIVKSIILVNTGANPTTASLFIRRGTVTSYRISPKDVSLPAGAAFIHDTEITMEGGTSTTADAIRGIAGATGVHCVINGVERDQ